MPASYLDSMRIIHGAVGVQDDSEESSPFSSPVEVVEAEKPGRSTGGFVQQLKLAVSLIVIFSVLLYLVCSVRILGFWSPKLSGSTSVLNSDIKFGIVIDCGSSGTRAHVYQWTDIAAISELSPSNDKDVLEVEPGLSSYVSNPIQAGHDIARLLAQ